MFAWLSLKRSPLLAAAHAIRKSPNRKKPVVRGASKPKIVAAA